MQCAELVVNATRVTQFSGVTCAYRVELLAKNMCGTQMKSPEDKEWFITTVE